MEKIWVPTLFHESFISISLGVTSSDDGGVKVATIPEFSFYRPFNVPSEIRDGYVKYYSNGDVYVNGSMADDLRDSSNEQSIQWGISLNASIGSYNKTINAKSNPHKPSKPKPQLRYDKVKLISKIGSPSLSSITFYPNGEYTVQVGSFVLGDRSFGIRLQKLHNDNKDHLILSNPRNRNEYTIKCDQQ